MKSHECPGCHKKHRAGFVFCRECRAAGERFLEAVKKLPAKGARRVLASAALHALRPGIVKLAEGVADDIEKERSQ